MKSTRVGLVLALLAAPCLAAACGTPPAASSQGGRIDLAAVLGTAASASAPAPAPGSALETTFEDRLRRASGAGAETPAGEPATRRALPLGSGLIADLPDDAGWAWGREETVTLARHLVRGRADALIYVEEIDPASRRPSRDLQRFLAAVAPDLVSPWMELADAAERARALRRAVPALTPREALVVLGALSSPTLGRGLGFTPHRDGFSGWRWIGVNAEGSFLRLARCRGRWGGQPPPPEALGKLLDRLERPPLELTDRFAAGGVAGDEVEAILVVGTAGRGPGGIHLAALCRPAASCAAGGDLVHWLDSIRAAPLGGVVETAGELWPIAADLGLDLDVAGVEARRGLVEGLLQAARGGSIASLPAEVGAEVEEAAASTTDRPPGEPAGQTAGAR